METQRQKRRRLAWRLLLMLLCLLIGLLWLLAESGPGGVFALLFLVWLAAPWARAWLWLRSRR